ncbi:flavin reductase family protein [uncultured Hoeflea sp.]|uniref:flavin reductase family protein n=1 Tax=uncultured Hoeflea sp. TaxID=538666 RepID=UPI0026019669|nr:flavin reductase family protein [uncultured Hoeflea sp.]
MPPVSAEAAGAADAVIERLPSPGEFRTAMRNFVGNVSVLTVGEGEDRSGLVVTSAISLSAEPPLLLACVNRSASSWPLFGRYGCFGWSALGAGHQKIAERFAGFGGIKGVQRYEGASWVTGKTGAPLLEDAVVGIDCTVEDMIDRATHSILIGRVRDIRIRSGQGALIYWNGTFRGLDD